MSQKAQKITEPGIYHDIATADYFADPCPAPSFTQSLAKIVIEQSALHARSAHPRLMPPTEDDEPEKYVAAQAIGNAAHRLLIGRGKEISEGKFDSWRKKDAQDFKAEAMAAGNVPILSKHLEQAVAMTQAARLQLEAVGWKDAFKRGHGEVVLAWKEGDLWFRCMIDWMVSTRHVADYKTSGGSFAPHVIGSKMEGDGWEIQAAMQERGLDVLDPEGAGRRTFRFVAQENYLPYALVPVEMNEHWMTMGRKKLEQAITIWRRCMETGIWQGYPMMPIVPDYPGYREAQWLDREVTFHESLQAMSRRREIQADFLAGG
jgi:hypothetical protein